MDIFIYTHTYFIIDIHIYTKHYTTACGQCVWDPRLVDPILNQGLPGGYLPGGMLRFHKFGIHFQKKQE